VILGEEMGRAGVSIPLTHISACCRSIALHGTEAQKERYLPDMASGKKIGGYCQTEPNAGSDSGNMTSFAELKDGYYLLNGTKNFISNADLASAAVQRCDYQALFEAIRNSSASLSSTGTGPGLRWGGTRKRWGVTARAWRTWFFRTSRSPGKT
jgi:alkylation response protein AidB-like acyl-CoA dehydrogenase